MNLLYKKSKSRFDPFLSLPKVNRVELVLTQNFISLLEQNSSNRLSLPFVDGLIEVSLDKLNEEEKEALQKTDLKELRIRILKEAGVQYGNSQVYIEKLGKDKIVENLQKFLKEKRKLN